MQTTRFVWGLCAAMITAGCGGGGTPPARSPDRGTARWPALPGAGVTAPAEADGPGLRSTAYAETPTPQADVPAATSAPDVAPRERPGLATQWGETRESPIRDVPFFRADPERPFAVAEIAYNDPRGVESLAAYRGDALRPVHTEVAGGAITVVVRDASGAPLPALRARDHTYVVGHEGERYTIAIANRTGRRFEAVATVDGLDVMSGKPGSVANRGYVLLPWQELEIDGFRQSEDEVAAFRFSRVGDSYAAQRGDARDVGIIGVAFFTERGDDASVDDLRARDSATAFPGDGRFAPPPR
jgi:hypothetical protein